MKKYRSALIPVAVAIAFAVFVIVIFGFEKVAFGDANDYMTAARSFLNNTAYPLRSEFHPMFRPPLYPLFIAGVWSVAGESAVAVKLAQAVLHGATCFVVYLIVFEVLRQKTPAFLGALVCAINPLLAAHTVDFFTETLHTVLWALRVRTRNALGPVGFGRRSLFAAGDLFAENHGRAAHPLLRCVRAGFGGDISDRFAVDVSQLPRDRRIYSGQRRF